MNIQPATSSSKTSQIRLWPWLGVLLVLLFVGYIRFRLLDMPLERDEGEYAYAGQLLLQGIPPYELAYNMKLPGTYFAYALGMGLFGQTSAGIHMALTVVNSLTVVFVFLLGRKLFGVTAGLVACTSYGIMSASPAVMGLAAHATHFVVLFAVPATLLLLSAGETNRPRTLFFSGLLYGLAFLMKQQGGCFGAFGWGFLVWEAARNKSIFSSGFAKNALMFGIGMVLPFGLTCVVLGLMGVFSEFWFWTFTYARSYVASMSWTDGIANLRVHLRGTFNTSIGFWLMAAVGLPFALFNRKIRNHAVFTLLFCICSLLGTAVGLYFRAHYFILMLPAFALILGMAVVLLQQALRFRVLKNVFKSLPVIFFATILAWSVFYQSQFFFQLSPDQVCESLYVWNPFIESQVVAKYIREHSPEDARIAVLGSEPEIYFYAHRRSATGYIYTYALMEPQPDAVKMQRAMMREIEASKPEYLVYVSYEFSWLFYPDSDRTIIHWFDDYGRRFYDQVGLVQMNSEGAIEESWGDAAKKNAPADQFITVYKRRPDDAKSRTR